MPHLGAFIRASEKLGKKPRVKHVVVDEVLADEKGLFKLGQRITILESSAPSPTLAARIKAFMNPGRG
jgi:hypothetical protein